MRQEKGYTGIDWFRIAAALLVMVIHISPFAVFGDMPDFLSSRVIARIAVPFFFVTSGFFLEKGLDSRKDKLVRYTKTTLQLYLAAIIIYLPVNVYMGYFKQAPLLPVIIKDLLFDGTMYHLWYFPAAILGAWAAGGMIKKTGKKKALLIALVLYGIGLLGDSYYGLASQSSVLHGLYDNLFTISDYTRNGLFFAPVFLVMGAWIAEKENRYTRGSALAAFIVSMLAMTAEGIILHKSGMQRHDSMYVMLLPCMWFFFHWISSFHGKRITVCRNVSAAIYMIHPLMIVVVRLAAKISGSQKLMVDNTLILYVLVLVLSGCFAVCCRMLPVQKNQEKTFSGKGYRAWLEISTENLKHNAEVLQKNMPESCKLMAVVKAEAYGHGGVVAAKILNQAGVDAFAVATLQEGIALREQEVKGDILILGYTAPEDIRKIKKYNLIQTVCDSNHGRALNACGIPVSVHVAVDTGMHRIGFSVNDVKQIAWLFHMKNLRVCGIFTHLCAADSNKPEDIHFTDQQIADFYGCLERLKNYGIKIPKVHMQSSYGFLNYPELHCHYVRAGISLYGADSRENIQTKRKLDLKPVLSLRSKVIQVRTIAAGETVGYGRMFRAETERKIAVVSIGYADGYPRCLSCGKGKVLVKGHFAPVIGRICMDQLMIDITDIGIVSVEDVVTLIGQDGDADIRIEKISGQADSIANELLSRMGSRLELVLK